MRTDSGPSKISRRLLFTIWTGLLLQCAFAPAKADELSTWVESEMDSIAKLYLHLHQNPERSLHEKNTSARIAQELRDAGYEVTTNIGGYGIVGLLKNGDGPCVMLRADLDALPVTEMTDLEYASKATTVLPNGVTTGVMHACGHDIHMTNLVAVARYLASHRDQWRGTLMLVGQPAEETGAGAKAMLQNGLFERFPKPDCALALHVDSGLSTGKVGCRAGAVMANVDSVDITMRGRGGHGSAPHTTLDPIIQAAELVTSLQSIVSREISPKDPAVITVGSIHGGSQHNIIGDQCHLQLTVRSYSDEVRKHLLEGIQRKAKAIAIGARAPEPVIVIEENTPSLFNDEKLTARVTEVLRKTLGTENIVEVEPSMGGEDFSRYGRAGVPIFMYRLGSVNQRRLDQMAAAGVRPPSLHSSKYYPDFEETLRTGVITMSNAVLDLMKP